MKTVGWLLATSLFLAACGETKSEAPSGDKPGSSAATATAKAKASSGHCMLQDKKCWEFPSGGERMRSMCSEHGKVVDDQLCPTAGVVGSCKGDGMRVRFYEGERPGGVTPWSKKSVADECKASGQTAE